MVNKTKKASDALKGLLKTTSSDASSAESGDYLTLYVIMEGLHGRGFGLLMLLFSLPLAIPLPVPPGYTTVLGSPLLVFSLQMMLGHQKPWMPKWLGEKKIARSTLATFIEKTSPWLISVEKILKPRIIWACEGSFVEKFCGGFCLLLAISIAIPLPLTNFVPAIGIGLISLGLLGRDGLIVLLGFVVGFLGLYLTAFVIIFGAAAAKSLFSFIMKL